MSLFTKLFEAVHSWRRRRGGTKSRSRKRSDLEMEQLDHRQLLTVNFTGVVTTDFPASQVPGVVYTGDPAGNQKPIIPPALQGVVSASGFEIDNIAVSYDSTTDILSVGATGPNKGVSGGPVIAGDSDNNGNSGTVNPSVAAIEPGFTDPPDMGGTKTYAITLDLTNSGTPDVVAGFPKNNPSGDPTATKPFEVAKYINNGSGDLFDSSNLFPQYTGNYFLENDPNHPNFEFQIDHFSQLYLQMTGHSLSSSSSFGIGAFATNAQDTGISDEVFPIVPISVQQATVPTPTPPPPPPPPSVSPTVYVNPHEDNHINTAHPTAIRVNILGSSGFDPTTIIPSTVKFGDPSTINTTGASPILNFESNVNHDEFPDETFVFNGLDVTLPSGITTAVIEGQTTSGTIFESEVKVFNRDYSFYSNAQIKEQQSRWLAYDKKNGIDTSGGAVAPSPVIPKAAKTRATDAAINDLVGPFVGQKVPKQVNATLGTTSISSVDYGTLGTASAASSTPAPTVVSIPTKNGKASNGVKITSVKMGSTVASSNSFSLSGGA